MVMNRGRYAHTLVREGATLGIDASIHMDWLEKVKVEFKFTDITCNFDLHLDGNSFSLSKQEHDWNPF